MSMGLLVISILIVIFLHYAAKLFITKVRKHEKENFALSRFRFSVIFRVLFRGKLFICHLFSVLCHL